MFKVTQASADWFLLQQPAIVYLESAFFRLR